MAAEELDALLLAKAQFAQTKADFRGAVEAPDTDSGTGYDATQRANKRVRTPAGFRANWPLFVHLKATLL
jgi:hypothetical protein